MGKASSRLTLFLRLLAFAATATATIVMVTSHQTTTFFSITMEARFQYTPAFKFFAVANAIATLYSLFILFVPLTSASSYSRLILASDMVIAMLLTAAVAATGAIAQVGKKGNQHAGWLPICGQIPKFCDQVMGSFICSFIAVLIYMVILFHAIHTVLNPLIL